MGTEPRPARAAGEPEDSTRTFELSSAVESDVIGSYRLVRQLGEGGMGAVYHAHQSQPIRREVALKVIKPGMDSRQIISRFESERQALAMMDHPNIARVFDAGATAGGRPYFVMELVNGIPITSYCDEKRLSVRERIELFVPVCHAIQHAHQKGIIHRDIKPSNLLVAEMEGKPVPKVIDFGLAKALGQKLSGETMLTGMGTVVGTLDYMSPEQAEIRQDIDTRSDVYSLGAVLYELLTGTTPIDHARLVQGGYLQALQQIRTEEVPPPSVRLHDSDSRSGLAAQRSIDPARLPKLLSGELDWITIKALEKDRARRYETVNGLARDLERYLQGEPVEAGAPSVTYRLGKIVRKHRAWLATAAAFAALLVGAAIYSSWLAVRASRAEQEARAINSFLLDDLLSQASAGRQGGPKTKPDPDLKVRTALDRAAAGIAGKFGGQPAVEASIRHTIGTTYRDLGLYPEAQRQLERALELRRRTLGPNHRDTLSTMNELAAVYWYLGNYAQAEPLYASVVELRKRLLGPENPDTLSSIYDLASTYIQEHRFPEAEALATKVLEVQRRTLGEENPATLYSMNNLAVMYEWQGKYQNAEGLMSKVVELRRRVQGDEHPDTLRSSNNLAKDYLQEGKLDQAEQLFQQTIAIQTRVQGPDHPDTLRTMYNLGTVYERQGKAADAEDLFSRILTARTRALGAAHTDTLNTVVSLGRARLEEGKFGAAQQTLRDALRTYEQAAPNRWERYYCETLLGAAAAGQKNYAQAEPLMVGGYEGMEQRKDAIPAENRAALDEARGRLAQLYRDSGKPEKGDALLHKVP